MICIFVSNGVAAWSLELTVRNEVHIDLEPESLTREPHTWLTT